MIQDRIQEFDPVFPRWIEVIVSNRSLDRKYRQQVACAVKSWIPMMNFRFGLLCWKWVLDLGGLDRIVVLGL